MEKNKKIICKECGTSYYKNPCKECKGKGEYVANENGYPVVTCSYCGGSGFGEEIAKEQKDE